jgi:hypothetical protein
VATACRRSRWTEDAGVESASADATPWPGLNEMVRRGRIKPLVEESLALYERCAGRGGQPSHGTPEFAGDNLRMLWVSGPSSSGKTTTTVKLTERLQQAAACVS